MQTLDIFAAGFGLGGSLIVAIGAQNAFVLRQGLRRQHPLPIAFLCFAIDALLILAGSLGLGTLVQQNADLLSIVRWAGAAFLFAYAGLALKRAAFPSALTVEAATVPSLRAALLTTLAVSIMNPHVYLDTVVLLGSLAGRYPVDLRWWFIGGALFASFVWFHGLAFGARWLAPFFARPGTWRVLDGVIAVIMASLGLSLVLNPL
ncbi:MAG: LysE/ArgO family amino acid transporter [Elstera sp.]